MCRQVGWRQLLRWLAAVASLWQMIPFASTSFWCWLAVVAPVWSDTVCWIVLRESYPNHTRTTPVSYLKPSTSRPWHILNAWVRYFTSLQNPENKTSLPIPPWHQSYGLNQPPVVRNKRASYSQLCLEPTIPAVRTSLGLHLYLGKPDSGLGGWFRPENHTCLSLSISLSLYIYIIYIYVQGYTQRYIKGWKVCWKRWKPLRYEVSSMWWSSREADPEAYPRSKPRSIPPKHTP